MDKNEGVYRKAQSLSGIRKKDGGDRGVRARLEVLSAALKVGGEKGDFEKIVASACRELLTDGNTTGLFSLQDHVVEEIARVSDADLPRYLFYRYRYDMFPAQKKLDAYPPCLQIEPTSVCNYRCVFCYQTNKDFTNRENGFMGSMDFALFKDIIDQAEKHVEAVTLASRGEPLMCRDIEKMLAYAAGKFLAYKVNTNAWFLDEKKAHALLSSEPNTLVFSADAAAEPLYSQLRVNGNLERVAANIRQFQEIRRRHYPSSKTITRVSGVRYNKEQSLDSMEAFWKDMVDQVAFVDYNPWENVYETPENEIRTPCSDLWRRMFVWWDGHVNPCDVDYKSKLCVGKIQTTPLSKLWLGDLYQGLRTSHLEIKRAACFPCNRCSVV